MTIAKYFWDLNKESLRETERALHNSRHPQFSRRLTTLLSRCDQPKELFAALPKEKFIEFWPKVRSYWMKRARQSEQRDWWDTIYEQCCVEKLYPKSIRTKGEPAALIRKFGDTIKEKRIEMGLNQKQLALRAGLKQPMISQIEEGKRNITLFTLLRLCKVLDIKSLEVSPTGLFFE